MERSVASVKVTDDHTENRVVALGKEIEGTCKILLRTEPARALGLKTPTWRPFSVPVD